jgi:hypothetical protein
MKTGALKLVVLGGISLMLVQYVPVYYHTMEFNRFVQEQVSRIRSTTPLQEAILSKAEEHQLPVTAENISMSTSDSVLRVNVDYQVPVNFYVFHQDLKFQARGSGLLPRSN